MLKELNNFDDLDDKDKQILNIQSDEEIRTTSEIFKSETFTISSDMVRKEQIT